MTDKSSSFMKGKDGTIKMVDLTEGTIIDGQDAYNIADVKTKKVEK